MEANRTLWTDSRIDYLQEEIRRLTDQLHEQSRRLNSQEYQGERAVTRDDVYGWIVNAIFLVAIIAMSVTVGIAIAG